MKKKSSTVKVTKKTKVKTKVKKAPSTLLTLAKELKIDSKELIGKLSELGIGVGSAKSALNETTVKRIKRALSKKKPTAQSYNKEKSAGFKKAPAFTKKRVRNKIKKQEIKPLQAQPETTPSVSIPTPASLETSVLPASVEETPNLKPMMVKLPIAVKDLASKMSIASNLLIKQLMGIRVMATINQLIDEEIAKEVGEKFGYRIEPLPTVEQETLAVHEKEDASKLEPRPPVVTFMGHVDHGKTSLLDCIRKSKIADLEKGGITQHIGAYRVHTDRGDITFLDTPGHEAFTAMRSRGATATDIVILVVAADDGIKPQTIEAIDHARAAEVPIIVALNKIDKPNIDLERVKKELSSFDLTPEDWGGKTIIAGVSAKTGEGVDSLLEMILLEAEMLELKADPSKPARGVVVEGKLSKGGGPIATVLIESGTLYPSDVVVCGKYYGKIRALINDRIHKIKKALPAAPVEILGLNGVPGAGDKFFVVDNERKAREITELRLQKIKEESSAPTARKISLEDLYGEIQKGSVKELKVILKADVQGSLEALRDSLMKINTKELKLNIIHRAVGEVSESDVLLASASNAIIIGLHTTKTPEAYKAVKKEGVD